MLKRLQQVLQLQVLLQEQMHDHHVLELLQLEVMLARHAQWQSVHQLLLVFHRDMLFVVSIVC